MVEQVIESNVGGDLPVFNPNRMTGIEVDNGKGILHHCIRIIDKEIVLMDEFQTSANSRVVMVRDLSVELIRRNARDLIVIEGFFVGFEVFKPEVDVCVCQRRS